MRIRSYRQTTLIPENFPGTSTPLFHRFPYHFNIQILEWPYAFLSAPAPTTALWQRSAERNLALSTLTAQERARERHQRSQDTNPPAGDCRLAGRRSTHRAQREQHTRHRSWNPPAGGHILPCTRTMKVSFSLLVTLPVPGMRCTTNLFSDEQPWKFVFVWITAGVK